jgi:chromate transporter
MPDWLRLSLIRGLDRDRLQNIVDLLQAFLQPVVNPWDGAVTLEISQREARSFREILLDWIAQDLSGELDDRILVGALRGRDPEQLATRVPDSLAQRFRAQVALNDILAVALGSATAVLVWIFHSQIVEAVAILPPIFVFGAVGLGALAWMLARTRQSATAPAPAPVTLAGLTLCFLQISLSSFAGGLSAWTQRIVVERRKLLSNEQFLNAEAISRLFPGGSEVNMAIFVGQHFNGLPGALAALLGVIGVPLLILLILGWAYFHYHTVPEVRAVLTGMVAAAAGMTLSMGFKLIGGYLRQPAALVFGAAAFAGVSVFHFSLPLVVLLLAPLAMAWYWPRGELPAAVRGES